MVLPSVRVAKLVTSKAGKLSPCLSLPPRKLCAVSDLCSLYQLSHLKSILCTAIMSATQVEVGNANIYSPRKVLDDPSFRILAVGEKTSPNANIAAFYNPAHEIHLVEKPRPTPGPGQVLLHVRATGICGCVQDISIPTNG